MTESIKVILSKKPEDLTEDDKKELQDAIELFQKEAVENCMKHGFEHKAGVQYTSEGIKAVLNIVPIKESVAEPVAE